MTEAGERLIAAAKAAAETSLEFAWIIEMRDGDKLLYFTCGPIVAGSIKFGTDPNEAIRFSRKEDADRVIQTFTYPHLRAVERGFA